MTIRKNLIKKVLDLLKNMDKEKYETFYQEFGAVLKEGIHSDHDKREKIAALARYKTTRSQDKWVSLDEYITNMQPGQKDIYYITGDNLSALANSPHLEKLKEKDYEILLMTDPVDEWVTQSLTEYEGKPLKSAEKGELDLDKTDDTKQKEYQDLFGFIKSQLETKVKEVKPSTRLKDSVACLSGDAYDMSAYMEKIMKASGQATPETKRVLEINTDHPVVSKIKGIYKADKDNPVLKDYSQMLFDVAVISEGGKVDNPAKFSKMVGDLMDSALQEV